MRWILVANACLGILAVFSGIATELTRPLPGPFIDAAYPVPVYIVASSLGSVKLTLTLFLHNVQVQGLILFTSILHFGLVAIYSIVNSLFDMGRLIGWFGKTPGINIGEGLIAYLPHFIPEFIAVCLISSLSVWIGMSLIRPDRGLSRLQTIKSRYRQALIATPLVLVLLFIGAMLESFVSIPLATAFSQKALTAEDTKLINDSEGRWSIEVPESWIEDAKAFNEKDREMKGMFLSGMNIPLCIEIEETTFENRQMSSAERRSIAESSMELIIKNSGQKIIGDFEEVKLAGHNTYRAVAIGPEPAFPNYDKLPEVWNREFIETLYFYIYFDSKSQSNIVIIVKSIIDPDYEKYSEPLIENILNSMSFQDVYSGPPN